MSFDDDCQAEAQADLEARGEPHWIRAAILEAATLGGGTAWYWIDRERQVADWDFPSLKQRITFEAWRYDNNPFTINWIWHPINGAGFHWIARSNDLSLHASFWYGFFTSMTWEWALEFREKVSINDVIATSGAGIPLGEFFHWLSRYLNSAPGPERPWHPYAQWTFGLGRTLKHTLDGTRGSRPGSEPDSLGLSSDIWHRFRLSYGYAFGDIAPDATQLGRDQSPRLHQLRLSGELAALPGYLRPGDFTAPFSDGNLPRASLAVSLNTRDIGVDLFTEVMLLGIHTQSVDPDRNGHALTAGIDLGYQYRKERLGAWIDRLGLVHLPAPALDAHLLGPDWHLEARLRARADFAGIHSLTHGAWKAAHPDAFEKSILRKQAYYYGWGYSARAELDLNLPYATIGGTAFHGRYWSDEGLDRILDEIIEDLSSEDRATEIEAHVRLFPTAGRWYLEGRYRHQDREHHLDGFDGEHSITRWILELGAEL